MINLSIFRRKVTTEPVIDIINEKFSGNNLDSSYTNHSVSYTVNNKLSLTNGDNTFTRYISKNYTTGFEMWTNEFEFKLNTIDSSSYGLGITIKSPILDFTIKLNCVSGVNRGKIQIYGYGTNLHATSLYGANLNTSDTFVLNIDRVRDVFTCSVINKNTKEKFLYTWKSDITKSDATNSLPKIGYPSLAHFGGNIDITSWRFYTKERKNPRLVILGDSITQCYYATTIANRYASKINEPSKVVLGCGGDTVSNLLTRRQDVYSLNPKNISIFIGANDTDGTTFNNNYRTLVSDFKGRGYNLILCSCIPRTGFDKVALNTIIQQIATDYTLQYIDIYTPMLGVGLFNADGVHPNDLGHTVMANTINNSIILI